MSDRVLDLPPEFALFQVRCLAQARFSLRRHFQYWCNRRVHCRHGGARLIAHAQIPSSVKISSSLEALFCVKLDQPLHVWVGFM